MTNERYETILTELQGRCVEIASHLTWGWSGDLVNGYRDCQSQTNYGSLMELNAPFVREFQSLQNLINERNSQRLHWPWVELQNLVGESRRYLGSLEFIEETLDRIRPSQEMPRYEVRVRREDYQRVHNLLVENTSRILTPENLQEVCGDLEADMLRTPVSMAILRSN